MNIKEYLSKYGAIAIFVSIIAVIIIIFLMINKIQENILQPM